MKLLVFADTHNRPQRMLEVVRREEKNLTACFFLGDGVRDADLLHDKFGHIPLYVAQGNCDPGSYEAYEGLAPFGGVLFFYTHGHTLNVKQDLDTLWWRARQRKAGAALFGHTHVPYYEHRNGVHLFNPGSLTMPRFGPPTFGRVTIENNQPSFEICRFTEEG